MIFISGKHFDKLHNEKVVGEYLRIDYPQQSIFH